MMKKVKMATPEFATSKTIVWWDMNSCPLPNGYDPSRVGPRIDTELKNLGYNGPLTIIGVGDLEGVPHGFLKSLSSGGVTIKQLSLGSNMIDCVIKALYRDVFQPPLSMMIITAAHADLLELVVCEFYKRDSLHYNLLLAYPAITEHADPEPSSLLVDNFGGELVWDRFGLLKDQGRSANIDTRRQDTGCEMHSCGLCDFSSDSFDDFATHLDLPQHARKMEKYVIYLEKRFLCEVEDFKALELDESYLAKVDAKRLEFDNDSDDSDDADDSDIVAPETEKAQSKTSLKMPKFQSVGSKFKFSLLCNSSSLKKKATAKPKKLSKEIAEEAESSLPKNATTTMSS